MIDIADTVVFQPCLQLPAPVIPQETIHEDQDFVHVPTAVQGVLSDGVGLPIADTTNDILMSLTEHKENEGNHVMETPQQGGQQGWPASHLDIYYLLRNATLSIYNLILSCNFEGRALTRSALVVRLFLNSFV